MRLKEFRFLQTHDPYDPTVANWSRRYEWNYALQQLLENTNGLNSVHNTCCGSAQIHWQFAEKISAIRRGVGDYFSNSDMFETNPLDFENYYKYDITTKCPFKSDCVLCISTLEDFLAPIPIHNALDNLLDQARKRVIITADIYDQVKVEWFASYFGVGDKLREVNALTGANSSYPQHEFSHIKILLIDVEK